MDITIDQTENPNWEEVWLLMLVAAYLKRCKDKHGLNIDMNTPFRSCLSLMCSYSLQPFSLFYSFSCKLMPSTQNSLEPGLTMPRNTAMLITSGSDMQYICTYIFLVFIYFFY